MGKGIAYFLNESLFGEQITEPRFIIPTGLKGWMSTINKALKLVPVEATPDIILSFNKMKMVVGKSMSKTRGVKFAVSMSRDSVEIPKEMVSDEDMKNAQDFSQYKNDDDGWNHVMELKKTIPIRSFYYGKFAGDFRIIGINGTAFKTPKALQAHKEKVQVQYFEQHGRNFWLNTDGLGLIVHELGHVYDNRKNISSKSDWISLVERWLKEGAPDYCKPIKDNDGFNYGTYGESFAEAFANYLVHGGKDLPEYIKKYIASKL